MHIFVRCAYLKRENGINLVSLPRRRCPVLWVDRPQAHKPHKTYDAASDDTTASRLEYTFLSKNYAKKV